mgnify:CR=1 FL=1
MKRIKTLFTILCASIPLSFSIGCAKNDPTFKFNQESLNLVINDRVLLEDLIKTSYPLSDISFNVDETSIASINNNYLIGQSLGSTTLRANYGNEKISLPINVISDTPTISYSKTNFTLDLSSETFDISEYISTYPTTMDFYLVCNIPDGYRIDGLKISFTKKGIYTFSLTGNASGVNSNAYTFVIDVFDRVNLSGEGTVSKPFLISSATDLSNLSKAVLDYKDFKNTYFKQTCDISLNEFDNWTPIGTFGVPFEGIYDGDNFKVTDIKIDTHDSWQGLFGFSSGVIKNVTVYGEIRVTCHPDYVYSHSFAGGVVGGLYNAAIVDNCKNYANVHGDAYVGGICGGIARSDEMIVWRDQSIIMNCENYGKITGDDTYAINESGMYFGGICGESLGILTANTNYGEVTVSGSNTRYVGGVCGLCYTIYKYGMYPEEDLEIYASNDNINYGTVTGYHSVGGVYGCTVLPAHRCKNYGDVYASICGAGVSGLNGTSAILENNHSVGLLEDCYNEGTVTLSTRYGGGITSYSYFDVINCTNNGEVVGLEGVYSLGGVVGYQSSGNVRDCFNDENGSITGYYGLGGIVGWSLAGYLQIDNCVNNGNVCILEDSDLNAVHIGGIVGMLGSSNSVLNCINNANIKGAGSRNSPERWGGTGGVAGSIYSNSVVFNSINNGNITGNQQIGGIVGYDEGSTGTTIDSCKNYGIISSSHANPHLGCIIGRCNNSQVILNENYGHYVCENAVQYYSYLVGSDNGATGYILNKNFYKEAE